jgi:hypothetical protein
MSISIARREIGQPERPGISSQPENTWWAARIVIGGRVVPPGANLLRADLERDLARALPDT